MSSIPIRWKVRELSDNWGAQQFGTWQNSDSLSHTTHWPRSSYHDHRERSGHCWRYSDD